MGTLPEDVARRSAEVADAVSDAVARHVVPSSTWLMAEHEHSRTLRTQMIERALRLSTTSGSYSDDDLQFFAGLGTLFARHAVPLQVLTAAFDVGALAITRESWRIAPTQSFTDMAQFTDYVARMIEQARQTSIHAYIEACRAQSGPLAARRTVAEALILGESALAAVQATGERLASSYLVLAYALLTPADAPQPATVHQHIDRLPGVLHCGDLSKLIVLLPLEFPTEASRRKAAATAAELADTLSTLTGQTVHAAQAYRPDLAGIPAAHEEACTTLSLVKAIPDADPRLYRMDELLVEEAISRQPDIRRRLTALLSPLDAGRDLRHTLEVLFACNLDRERAADHLHIHRRTLRYRMDRIRDLSGIDLDSAHGLQLLRAALTATRLAAQEPHDPQPETAAADRADIPGTALPSTQGSD